MFRNVAVIRLFGVATASETRRNDKKQEEGHVSLGYHICCGGGHGGALGFGGVAGLPADLAKILLLVAAIMLVFGFVLGRGARVS